MHFLKPRFVALLVLAMAGSAAARGQGVPPAPPAPPPLTAAASSALAVGGGYEEDLDVPVIVFGRAVDLAGVDIEPIPHRAPGAATGPLGMVPRGRPLAAARMTSGFGNRVHPLSGDLRFHAGVDLAAPLGTPVRATSAGRVSSAGWAGGYGNLVALQHGGRVETRYGHLSSFAVRAGDTVTEGQIIGYVGSTGNSTGPHLHYEARVAGQPRDPRGGWR